MNTAHSPAAPALFGDEEHLSVSRALGELQARRPIRVNAPGEVLFALPVESLDDQRLHEFVELCGPNEPEL
jgi:GTP cyclohydrolase II